MELAKAFGKSSKAQLMTILMLLLFMLMLAELFSLVLFNINTSSVAQSAASAAVASSYGSMLNSSAGTFAGASLERAISVLATYESTPSLRKGNFITNTSLYLASLVRNGTLPNDTSGYPENAMGNLTLAGYNASIVSQIGMGAGAVNVTETVPRVFQADAYHISVAYTMRLLINTTSGNRYNYSIPVSVSLPLNGTPDLYYAQQGVLKQVSFAGIGNLTSVIGNTYASSGNILAYAYGTVYWLQSSSTSGASCSSVPAQFSAAPMDSNIILATYNAVGLEGCENSYAGLIAYIAPTTLPTVPYLIYPSASNILGSLPSGTRVLLYGPGMETLDIEALRNAVANGYYFASPFTPSYLDRAQVAFGKQSQNGAFAFSNYNRQAASFDGTSSYITTGTSGLPAGSSARSVFAWIYYKGTAGTYVYSYGTSASGERAGLQIATGNVLALEADGYSATGTIPISAGSWHLVGYTYSSGSSQATLYVDGNGQTEPIGSALDTVLTGSTIGAQLGGASNYFSGSIADVQVYSAALSSAQAHALYQEGVSGLPISGNTLAAWWPLNGNANDYSGQGNNGAATSIAYTLLPNYTRDSILDVPVRTALLPLPGILSCTSTSSCASNTIPKLYLGSMPLEASNSGMQAGSFNGASGYVSIPNANVLNMTGALTLSVWVYPESTATQENLVCKGNGNVAYNYCLYLSPDIEMGGGSSPKSGYTPSLDEWSHIAVTYTGSDYIFYVNGVPVNTIAGSLGSENSNSLLLGWNYYSTQFFQGYMADLQIYNTSLTSNQVMQLYKEGAAGMPLSGNIVGWWPLSGNANDYSGMGNNGTTTSVTYPYFSGTYNAPGLSAIATSSNEWQALGIGTLP